MLCFISVYCNSSCMAMHVILPRSTIKMAAYQRSETTVHSLLFHVLAFSILLGNILYQHFNIITPATKIFPGRLKYLTYINEVGG